MALYACGRKVVAHPHDAEIAHLLISGLARTYGTPKESQFEAETEFDAGDFTVMKRLLRSEDLRFLVLNRSASMVPKFRDDHRLCFLEHLRDLSRKSRRLNVIKSRELRRTGEWSARDWLARRIMLESSLFYLRWLAFKYGLGFEVDLQMVSDNIKCALNDPLLGQGA